MEKPNELPPAFYGVIQGGKVVMLAAEDGQWLNKTSVAEAFRAMEKRAEAAEAKLTELEKQKPVCFIHPEMLYCVSDGSRTCGRVWGESLDEISNEDRLPLFARPAPAADLAELVPPEADGSNFPFAANGWNACRAEMLAKLENHK